MAAQSLKSGVQVPAQVPRSTICRPVVLERQASISTQLSRLSTNPPKIDPSHFEPQSDGDLDLCESKTPVSKKRKTHAQAVDPSLPSQPSTTLSEQALAVRALYLQSARERRARRERDSAPLVHYYTSQNQLVTTNGASVFVNVGGPSLTGLARTGNAVDAHSVTIRCHFWLIGADGGAVPGVWQIPSVRIVLWRAIVPAATPPTVANFMEFAANPASDAFVFSSNTTAALGGALVAFRSPLSFDQNEVYYDKVHVFKNVVTWSQGGTEMNTFASEHVDIHVPLRYKSTFFGSGNTDIATNSLSLAYATDAVAGSNSVLYCSSTTDFVFSNASET